MEFKIKSKFEIGDYVDTTVISDKPNATIIDIRLSDNYKDISYYTVEYLVEWHDKTRTWINESNILKIITKRGN